jgi:hypothetical protein
MDGIYSRKIFLMQWRVGITITLRLNHIIPQRKCFEIIDSLQQFGLS